jgi:hypothetical protein
MRTAQPLTFVSPGFDSTRIGHHIYGWYAGINSKHILKYSYYHEALHKK